MGINNRVEHEGWYVALGPSVFASGHVLPEWAVKYAITEELALIFLTEKPGRIVVQYAPTWTDNYGVRRPRKRPWIPTAFYPGTGESKPWSPDGKKLGMGNTTLHIALVDALHDREYYRGEYAKILWREARYRQLKEEQQRSAVTINVHGAQSVTVNTYR